MGIVLLKDFQEMGHREVFALVWGNKVFLWEPGHDFLCFISQPKPLHYSAGRGHFKSKAWKAEYLSKGLKSIPQALHPVFPLPVKPLTQLERNHS
jgi:hypothetical protein